MENTNIGEKMPRLLSATFGGTLENVYTHGMDMNIMKFIDDLYVPDTHCYYKGIRPGDVLYSEWDKSLNLRFWWCLNGTQVRIIIGSTDW